MIEGLAALSANVGQLLFPGTLAGGLRGIDGPYGSGFSARQSVPMSTTAGQGSPFQQLVQQQMRQQQDINKLFGQQKQVPLRQYRDAMQVLNTTTGGSYAESRR